LLTTRDWDTAFDQASEFRDDPHMSRSARLTFGAYAVLVQIARAGRVSDAMMRLIAVSDGININEAGGWGVGGTQNFVRTATEFQNVRQWATSLLDVVPLGARAR
jgi:hypothetical protein